MQFTMYHFDDLGRMFLVVLKIEVINIHHQKPAFPVATNPVVVAFVQALEVVQTDAAFVIAATGLDVINQRRYARLKVDHQIGGFDLGNDGLKKVGVIFKVAAFHEAHIGQVGRKNESILVDGTVLYHRAVALLNFQHLLVAAG